MEEGLSENSFIGESEVDGTTTNDNNELIEEMGAPAIVNSINMRGRVVDNDSLERSGEIHVDDDNAPAPKNIPYEGSKVPNRARIQRGFLCHLHSIRS